MTENGSSGTCFLRKCGAAEGNCQSPDFQGGVAADRGGADRGESSDFCAKSLQKHLKVLFIVSLLCDTVFTGEIPGIKQTHRRETP